MKKIIAMLFVLGFLALPKFALAASDDECAIWLCAPAGFAPSECGAAKRAMIDRIKDRKSPLPSINSCIVDVDLPFGNVEQSDITSDYNNAAYIPEHKICTEWKWTHDDRKICIQDEVIPETYVHGTVCRDPWGGIWNGGGEGKEYYPSDSNPPFCTKTYKYIEVYIDGEKAGETHYFTL